MQIKEMIKNRPGNTDFSFEYPMVITKLKIIAEHLGVGAEDGFESGKCDRCDRIHRPQGGFYQAAGLSY